MIIAIDGPAGSGKSTIAKLVAQRLGFSYLDTGAMYRAVAFQALDQGVLLSDPLSPESLSALAAIAEHDPITFGFEPGEALPSHVFIAGVDVSTQIRSPAIDQAVSVVSADRQVRAALTVQQREFGQTYDTVMEGRDIGTVVFPNAEVKIFLTASAEERAQRRTIQNAARTGKNYNLDEYERILADINRRDAYDSSREVSPLTAAEDAVVIDTTDMSIEAVVESIVQLAELHR